MICYIVEHDGVLDSFFASFVNVFELLGVHLDICLDFLTVTIVLHYLFCLQNFVFASVHFAIFLLAKFFNNLFFSLLESLEFLTHAIFSHLG